VNCGVCRRRIYFIEAPTGTQERVVARSKCRTAILLFICSEMASHIHPSAIIEAGAEIGDDCRIGPYCLIGRNVVLGARNVLHSHVVIGGHTTVSDGNEIHPFACLGTEPEDKKYRREAVTYTHIGSGNVFREYATVNASSTPGESTVVGSNGLFLSYSHIAHDCIIGDNVVISCDSKLSGHVKVEDHAIINGKTGVVQFVRIGSFAFIGGMNKVTKDVLPFCIADGHPSVIRGINKVGLERNGFEPGRISAIRAAYRTLLRQNIPLRDAIAQLKSEFTDQSDVSSMISFAATSVLGLARSRMIGKEVES
jgi:UDP-N-acetylglucosamine acyltransferase